jgi:hypothetical protein
MALQERSMHSTIRKAVAALAIAAALIGSAAAVAVAAGGPVTGGPAGNGTCAAQAGSVRSAGTVAALRAFGDCEINRRFATLTGLATVVSGAKGTTAADRAALDNQIATMRSGLTALKGRIDAASTAAALKLDIVAISSKFRVYVLLAPKVNLVRAADDVLALKPHFATVSADLAARIATAQANGKDVTTAQAALADMNSKVAAAEALVAPLPGRLLPLTPAQFDAGTASPILTSARTAIVAAGADMKLAVADAQAVVTDLK